MESKLKNGSLNAERISEYYSRFNSRNLKAIQELGKFSDELSAKVGEEVYFSHQIRTMACLLGFADSARNFEIAGAHQITYGTYQNAIVKNIPADARVDCRQYTSDSSIVDGVVGYRRSGVEGAFAILRGKGRMVYSPEKFEQARKIALFG